jgi:hypothetical protein
LSLKEVGQCRAKVGIGKHDTFAPTYKEMKFSSTNNVDYGFWFCHDNIKLCLSGSKKEYVMPIVSNTWPLKIGTTVSREKIPTLELTMFLS